MTALLKMFDIIPGWVWALITAGALAAAGVSQTRFTLERADHATTRAQYAEQVAQAEAATRIASEKNRQTEQELRNAQETNEQQAQALLVALDHAVAVDRVAVQRLRDAAQDLAAVARSRCAVAPTPGYSTPGEDPIGVLADVLGRADQRAGELAAIADERRIRGLACESQYDAARQALSG